MDNQFITTTDLRKQSSKLIKTLFAGKGVNLIYRSKVIAQITPISFSEQVIDDSAKLENLFVSLKPKKVMPKEKRKQIYRKHLEQRYGKNLS